MLLLNFFVDFWHFSNKERLWWIGLCGLGWTLSPLTIWFIIPYLRRRKCEKRYRASCKVLIMLTWISFVFYLFQIVLLSWVLWKMNVN